VWKRPDNGLTSRYWQEVNMTTRPGEGKYRGWDIYYLEPHQRPKYLDEYEYIIMKHPMAMRPYDPKTLPHYVKTVEEARQKIDEIEGGIGEAESERPGVYWEVTNMVTGKTMQYHTAYPTTDHAIRAAQDVYADTFPDAEGQHLVIKIYNRSPEERAGLTYTPIHTESYWIGEPSQAAQRLPPQTYGDWVNLAEDIKQKMPPESWSIVNELLQVISQEEGPVAGEAKRWLTKKAGELGIT